MPHSIISLCIILFSLLLIINIPRIRAGQFVLYLTAPRCVALLTFDLQRTTSSPNSCTCKQSRFSKNVPFRTHVILFAELKQKNNYEQTFPPKKQKKHLYINTQDMS